MARLIIARARRGVLVAARVIGTMMTAMTATMATVGIVEAFILRSRFAAEMYFGECACRVSVFRDGFAERL